MAQDRVFQEEAAAAWQANRQGIIEELELLSEEELDFRPHADSRTIRELVHHIVESERIIAGEALRPDGDFWRQSWDAFTAEYASGVSQAESRAELLALLRQHDNAARITEADPAFLRAEIRSMMGSPSTRLSVVQFGNAHEYYHRGQLAMCVRLLDKTPALTRKFQSA